MSKAPPKVFKVIDSVYTHVHELNASVQLFPHKMRLATKKVFLLF